MIAANARRYPVSAQCRVLGVPRSTYHHMLARPPRPKPPDPIGPDVLGAFEASRGGYGARRPKVALERSGITAPRRRICRIMRENGLSSSCSGRAPKGGARPARPPSAENVLARAFDGHAPRAHVASDLTYVRAGGSWCYACLLVDLYNREIVGCSCGRRKDARLVKAAFSNVPFPLTEIEVFHSDSKNAVSRLCGRATKPASCKPGPHRSTLTRTPIEGTNASAAWPAQRSTPCHAPDLSAARGGPDGGPRLPGP